MKKITFILLILCISSILVPQSSRAAFVIKPAASAAPGDANFNSENIPGVGVVEMNKQAAPFLKITGRENLKTSVISHRQHKGYGGGVYISVGALILIIILILILL